MFAYKIDISNEVLDTIRLKSFKLGYYWEVNQLIKDESCKFNFSYLYLNKNGTIFFSNDIKYFQKEREHKLITIQEFLDL
jgi:hypothetical protein